MTTYTLPLSSNTIDLLANSSGYNVQTDGVYFPGDVILTTNLSDPLPFDYYDILAVNAYNQANTATNLAQTVYDYANTISGGAAIDNVARALASSASSNTIILQGVDVTQNTRLGSIETINTDQNTSISIIQGVDVTQNTRLGSIETINSNQNTSISIIQGVDVTQNTRLSSIETINSNQNTSISIIQGVDNTQNTNITAVNNYASSAYDAANNASSAANNKVSTITGTTNQINTTGGTTPTLSLPQNINTGASVEFGSLGVGTAASGTSGEIIATNNITAYFSDDRLKTKLGNISNSLEKIKTLNGFYYEANEIAQKFGYESKKEVGLSAQEVQKILPEIVVPAPIDNQYLTIRYEKMIPLLVECIKELNKKVEELENKLKL